MYVILGILTYMILGGHQMMDHQLSSCGQMTCSREKERPQHMNKVPPPFLTLGVHSLPPARKSAVKHLCV